MNRGNLLIVLVALCAMVNAACGSGNSTTTLAIIITTAPTSMVVGSTANVAATVTDDPKNGGVTWSCTPAPFCGAASFNPDQTASGANSAFTAPSTVPPGSQQVTIMATSVTDTSISSNSVNITIEVASNNFSFYVTGKEANDAGNTYSIAGVVTIAADGSGNVLGGIEDYNDGKGITSPQPNGDSITGGSLVMADDNSGNGILTLMIPGNTKLGVNGVESFAVNFPNSSHALITQFDGTVTSSGSFDLQTLTTIPSSGSFSFVASGAGVDGEPVADGGIFTITGSSIAGFVDINDGGAFSRNTAFSGLLGISDTFGRGTVTNNSGFPVSLIYYVVAPEVIRIINVDQTDTAVGSAFGQGGNSNFSNNSIRQSVFSLENNPSGYAAAGQFSTSPQAAAIRSNSNAIVREIQPVNGFNGVGDLNELDGAVLTAASITGTYNLAPNGYGTFNFDAGFGDVATLGIYAVDPALNVLDPNNPSAGGGSAVLAEMDRNLVGVGVLLPQSDITVAHFAGFYAFGGQGQTFAGFNEFDFLGGATVSEANAAFAGTGSLSDPFATLTAGVESQTATFAATASPDRANPGRYTLNPVAVASSASDFAPFDFTTVTAYQANGQQLFWLAVDPHTEFGGSLQQNPASVLSDAKKAKPKNQKR
ncbi:MAG: hypothetical protein WCD43_05390 [Candidatus Acidiferrales bacterium]